MWPKLWPEIPSYPPNESSWKLERSKGIAISGEALPVFHHRKLEPLNAKKTQSPARLVSSNDYLPRDAVHVSWTNSREPCNTSLPDHLALKRNLYDTVHALLALE